MATLAPTAPDTRPQAGAPAVRLTGIRRAYGEVVAVADIDLDIGPNVVAFFVIVLTVIPVALAQRVMRDTGVTVRGAAAAAQAQQA